MDALRSVVSFEALGSVGLIPNRTCRLENGRGTRLHVETGMVWVTHEGCEEDIILGPGESYRIPRDGVTLLSTLRVPFALVTLDPAKKMGTG